MTGIAQVTIECVLVDSQLLADSFTSILWQTGVVCVGGAARSLIPIDKGLSTLLKLRFTTRVVKPWVL